MVSNTISKNLLEYFKILIFVTHNLYAFQVHRKTDKSTIVFGGDILASQFDEHFIISWYVRLSLWKSTPARLQKEVWHFENHNT